MGAVYVEPRTAPTEDRRCTACLPATAPTDDLRVTTDDRRLSATGPATTDARRSHRDIAESGRTAISFSRLAYRRVLMVCSQEREEGEMVAIIAVVEFGFVKQSRRICGPQAVTGRHTNTRSHMGGTCVNLLPRNGM